MLTLSKYDENLLWVYALRAYLENKKQKVEPTELANDPQINPGQNPNKAPASKVLRSEIGNANAVTTT